MESERAAEHIVVLIGGGGLAGLALAIALRQGSGPLSPSLLRIGAGTRVR
jgi:cation diffusion facilitator CzcD-associated flavoprotein CzcO